MRIVVLLSIMLCFTAKGETQNELNNYKYVIVPTQYNFLKGKDTYKLSTLTRVLFKKEGFKVYYIEENLPNDLSKDRCLALYVAVQDVKGGFLVTKLQLVLKDCHGNIVFTSEVGRSTENNHQKAHNEALREAFKSIEELNYKYTPVSKPNIKNTIETLSVKTEEIDNSLTSINNKDRGETQKDIAAIKSSYIAQPIDNGFELFDAKSKSAMILLNTAKHEVYIVKGKDAIVFRNNNDWIYSENNGKTLANKTIEIKF